MSQDIAKALEGWNFDPHELNVRIIQGVDGQQKIQMRIDLGLLQMTLAGRPDGQRPYGCESALDYFEQEATNYGEGYALSSEALEELFREGLQYYNRYLCLFHLGKYELVIRDTERNLRMFRFVLQHAKKRRDQWRFDQYRPYVVMMNTRAQAMVALSIDRADEAVGVVQRGCQQIREFLEHYGRGQDECFELDFLERWGEELKSSGKTEDPEVGIATPQEPEPTGPAPKPRENNLALLRRQLAQAIEREEYERAGVIRDRIKRMEKNQRDSA